MNYLSDGHFWNLHEILHQTHIYVFSVRQIQKKLFSFEHLPFFLFFWFFAKIMIFRSRAPVLDFTVTLDASKALLRHKNFDGKTKISKIEKYEDWVGWPSGSLIMSFEVIFWEKLDCQVFCSAVIPSEGLTLDASRALVRHKNFDGKTKMSKIE